MERRQYNGRDVVRGGLFSVLLLGAATGFATEEALERELQRLGPLSGGVMGIAAVHLESGRKAFLNADEPFPMASTYKVPIAVELLQRVDEGKLDLAQMIPNGAGHVIVAAFVKKSDRPEAERERAIAEAARAAHDYFLFTTK